MAVVAASHRRLELWWGSVCLRDRDDISAYSIFDPSSSHEKYINRIGVFTQIVSLSETFAFDCTVLYTIWSPPAMLVKKRR